MKAKAIKYKVEEVTVDLIKNKRFGCCNCMYAGTGCYSYDHFVPSLAYNGEPSCKNYVYYD